MDPLIEASRILFVTSTSLATNPRLVKEVELALESGYQPAVAFFEFENWSKPLNDTIIARWNGDVEMIGLKFPLRYSIKWWSLGIRSLLAGLFRHLGERNKWLPLSDKRAMLLHDRLNSCTEPFDLIIAHNPGAIYPAFALSEKRRAMFAFDIEDYHPGESVNKAEQNHMRQIFQAYLKSCRYLSAASPLILDRTLTDILHYNGSKCVVLNGFAEAEFPPPREIGGKMKLVWFSQYIDKGRGLEWVLDALKVFGDNIELHLYGNLREDFFRDKLATLTNIVIHEPIPQPALNAELSNYDIGLAFEDRNANFNRDICLTNKIIAYMQSGLFVLASNTSAQKAFIEQNQESGMIVDLDGPDIIEKIGFLLDRLSDLRQQKNARHAYGSRYSWENESKKIRLIWDRLLKNERYS